MVYLVSHSVEFISVALSVPGFRSAALGSLSHRRPPPPSAMAANSSEPGAAILRPLQNKIRNLRKAIDRAAPLEAAAARGEVLQADQVESVRSRPAKVALLADLEEILRKQESAAVDAFGALAPAAAPMSAAQGESKRAAKRKAAAAAAAEAAAAAAAAVESGGGNDVKGADGKVEGGDRNVIVSTEVEGEDAKAEAAGGMSAAASDAGATGGLSVPSIEGVPESQISNGGEYSVARSVPEPANDLGVEPAARVKNVIELLHVVEFLKDPENKLSLVAHFAGREAEFSAIDADIVLYFGAMLVSPNGNIPHAKAVDTSTSHCQGYLTKPSAEPFSGTSYGRLSQIVSVIGQCSLLERNPDSSEHPPVEAARAATAQKAAPDSGMSADGNIQSAATPPANTSATRHESKTSSGEYRTHRGGGRGRGGRGGARGRGGPYRGRGGYGGARGRVQ